MTGNYKSLATMIRSPDLPKRVSVLDLLHEGLLCCFLPIERLVFIKHGKLITESHIIAS